ncbi:MAG: nuclear pore protein 84/107 [Podila humilis]|nr:MAG: nuclear pore protein 84/107 [Podila humilis]
MDWTNSKSGGGFSFSNSKPSSGLSFQTTTTTNPSGGFSLQTTTTTTTTSATKSTKNANDMDVDVPSAYSSLKTGNATTTTTTTRSTGAYTSYGSLDNNVSEYQASARVVEKHLRDKTDLATNLTQALEALEELCAVRAKQQGRGQGMEGAGDYNEWHSESCTYLLLNMLFRDQEDKPTLDDGRSADVVSDKDLIDRLKNSDPQFKHHLTVKAWLQEIAPSFNQTIMKKNYGAASIISAKPAFSFQPSSQLASPSQKGGYQDPDALTRDGTKLSEQNQSAERELLKTVWEHVRRGHMQDAKEACVKAGEHWRAESIGGGEFYTELPEFSGLDTGRPHGPQGNKSRSLWKGTCYALASDTSADQYERAIYGALSGDVNTVLPICGGWEDHAWVQYNALVENMIEAQLSKYRRGDPCSELPLPKVQVDEARDVFAAIDSSDRPELGLLSEDMFFRIQKSIILGQSGQLLAQLAKEARLSYNMGRPLHAHKQRFLAHLVLFLRLKGQNVPKEDGDYFVKSYTDYLISEKMYGIAPLYASYLPRDLQVETCSAFLKTYNGKSADREKQLAILRKYGVDVHRVLVATVDQLLEKSKKEIERATDFVSSLQTSIQESTSKQEREVVRILEWLSFDPSGRVECLKRSNSIMRKYLARGRLSPAFALFNTLPEDIEKAVDGVTTPEQIALSTEHMYYQDFFGVRVLYEDWLEVMQSKPTADAPGSEIMKWEADAKTKANDAAEEIEKLLKSKWLSSSLLPNDEARNKELLHIRQVYISELVMNLHKVYFESRFVDPAYLGKSLTMVNLVAGTSWSLHKELQESKRLQELLDQVRLSSLELLRAGKSPLA